MALAQLIPLAIQLSMAIIIFCVALDARFSDLTFLWRRPSLLLRSLLSMLVVMPVVAVAMAMLFDLNDAVELALVASALSPVPPILPNKQIKAGGEPSYVVGLLTSTALVSIAYVPLVATLLGDLFHRPVDVSVGRVTAIVATSMLLPVLAGMAVRRLAPALARRIDKPLSMLATLVLVAACVPILIKEWPAWWRWPCLRRSGSRWVTGWVAPMPMSAACWRCPPPPAIRPSLSRSPTTRPTSRA